MIRGLIVLAFAAALVGCNAPRVPLAAPPPEHAGMFTVSTQEQRQPTVVIQNSTSAFLHLLLNAADGGALNLTVQPQSTGRIDVPKGHYEAKVYDEQGKIKSAYGTVDIADFKTYRTEFVVDYGASRSFHIGD